MIKLSICRPIDLTSPNADELYPNESYSYNCYPQAEMDLNTEKRQMQQTLQTALSQLKSQDDVVDRILLSNLLVSYFQRRKSKDVLDLIAKVLNFSDEQKEAVGLKVPPNNLFSTLFSFAAGSSSSSSSSSSESSPESLKGPSSTLLHALLHALSLIPSYIPS